MNGRFPEGFSLDTLQNWPYCHTCKDLVRRLEHHTPVIDVDERYNNTAPKASVRYTGFRRVSFYCHGEVATFETKSIMQHPRRYGL